MARQPSANLKQPDMPDTVRRRDIPDADKAGMRDDKRLHGVSPPEDGGVPDHPIHDYDQEDLGPEDYERLTDEVAKTGIKPG